MIYPLLNIFELNLFILKFLFISLYEHKAKSTGPPILFAYKKSLSFKNKCCLKLEKSMGSFFVTLVVLILFINSVFKSFLCLDIRVLSVKGIKTSLFPSSFLSIKHVLLLLL